MEITVSLDNAMDVARYLIGILFGGFLVWLQFFMAGRQWDEQNKLARAVTMLASWGTLAIYTFIVLTAVVWYCTIYGSPWL